jgi:rabankyrin-5
LKNEFTPEDFVHMPAALLYKLFKTKTTYPLHAAIKTRREDVVFLYLIENDSIVSLFDISKIRYSQSHLSTFFVLKLKIKLNEFDDDNNLPLDLALQTKQESIAINLVRNHADVNKTDRDGLTLLHKAVNRSNIIF